MHSVHINYGMYIQHLGSTLISRTEQGTITVWKHKDFYNLYFLATIRRVRNRRRISQMKRAQNIIKISGSCNEQGISTKNTIFLRLPPSLIILPGCICT